jgi:hypothetical protein
MKSLIFTKSTDDCFNVHRSFEAENVEQAREIHEGSGDEKVVAFVRIDNSDCGMSTIAGVIDLAMDTEVAGPNSKIRKFLLEIFMLGRSVK